ncbi:hypothetical protein SDC9_167326 [bioreactor metagenome]|uniref:Uncharacterized protein n=1 Tax=bioreactor metagenome TaxID=1076179 RepID=A0A645FZH7_9ZZZZ
MLRKIKSCRNNSYDYRITDFFINCDTEDDVNIAAGRFSYILNRIIGIISSNRIAAGHINNRIAGSLNLSFQQWRLDSLLGCFLGLIITLGHTDPNESCSLSFHNGSDIRKVQINQRRNSNQIRNGLNTLS